MDSWKLQDELNGVKAEQKQMEYALARYEQQKAAMRKYAQKKRDEKVKAEGREPRPVGRPRKNAINQETPKQEEKQHSPDLVSFVF
jgi:hypothetical protein